jgi:hypothetical protein
VQSGRPPKALKAATVGDDNHRWLTAQGPFSGNIAQLEVFLTTGGLFDDPAPVINTPEGTITLTFQDCTSGTVEYEFTSAAVSGSVPISRLADDNVDFCQSIDGMQAQASNNAAKNTLSSKERSDPAAVVEDAAESTGFEINPGLNGSWFNPETTGQGFFLDVLPETDLVFIAWFTYDTTQAAQVLKVQSGRPPKALKAATVGDDNHRWLTAQGPFSGNIAQLEVFLTTGGLFDDPAPVINTPEGTITLTFQDCTSGTVEYEFTSAAVSGSVPISRLADDNVALCELLSNGIVLDKDAKNSAVLGSEGGALEVADAQGNVLSLSIPEGALIGTSGQLIGVMPLSPQTTLPIGIPALTGMQWLSEPGNVIGPAKLEIFTAEAGRYAELAAFAFAPGGKNFHYIPLIPREENGLVLEALMASPGLAGVAFVTADEMELWPPPADPPEAMILQEIAIILKRFLESDASAMVAARDSIDSEQSLSHSQSQFVVQNDFDSASLLPQLKIWFDNFIEPFLDLAAEGCSHSENVVRPFRPWLSMVQQFGLEQSPELASRIAKFRNAANLMNSKAIKDIDGIDTLCGNEPDPCEQARLLKDALRCDQIMNMGGFEAIDTDKEYACSDAPAYIEVEPRNSTICPGDTVNFSATIKNLKELTLAIDLKLHWSSTSPELMTVNSESGVALAVDEGDVVLEVSSCEGDFFNDAKVEISGVPDILGSYSVAGSEKVRGCEFDEDNGTYGGKGTATIWLGIDHGVPGTENFSGVGTSIGLGEDFDGTIQCGGALSGSGTYTETDPCPEGTCVTSGMSTFTGSLRGNTIKVDTTAQDISGDTCTAKGWATATRNN